MLIKNVHQEIELSAHQESEVLKIKIVCKIVICYCQRIPKFGHSSNFPNLTYVILILSHSFFLCGHLY